MRLELQFFGDVKSSILGTKRHLISAPFLILSAYLINQILFPSASLQRHLISAFIIAIWTGSALGVQRNPSTHESIVYGMLVFLVCYSIVLSVLYLQGGDISILKTVYVILASIFLGGVNAYIMLKLAPVLT